MDSSVSTHFREHVALQLLDAWNVAQCRKHISCQPCDAYFNDGKMAARMAAAGTRALELGLDFNLCTPLHSWAIAMLEEKTQFTNDVMLAILQADFEGRLAVVTISQLTLKGYQDPLKRPKELHFYELHTD
jgi:hypothetical protein